MAEIVDMHGIKFGEAKTILDEIGFSTDWSSDEFLAAAMELPAGKIEALPDILVVACAGFRATSQATCPKEQKVLSDL